MATWCSNCLDQVGRPSKRPEPQKPTPDPKFAVFRSRALRAARRSRRRVAGALVDPMILPPYHRCPCLLTRGKLIKRRADGLRARAISDHPPFLPNRAVEANAARNWPGTQQSCFDPSPSASQYARYTCADQPGSRGENCIRYRGPR